MEKNKPLIITLPITYCGIIVAQAKVDEEFADLLKFTWHARFTERFLAQCERRADLVTAYLREDPRTRCRLYPRTCLHSGLWINLAHIVLRPRIFKLMLQYRETFPFNPKVITDEINEIRFGIGRIVYLTSDRTDCRLSNLREVKDVIEEPISEIQTSED